MGKRRRAHLDDYVAREDGTYEYRGARWRWDDPSARDPFLSRAGALDAAAGACLLGAGFVPAGSIGAFYVLVPYAAAFVLWALGVRSLVIIAREGNELRDHVYQAHAQALVAKLAAALVAAAASAVGTIIHALLTGHFGPSSMAFAALLFASALCLGHLTSRAREVTFSKV